MSRNNLIKNTKNLVLMTVGTFENSKIENFFRYHFSNIIRYKTKNEAINYINENKVDLILCSNNNSFNNFDFIEEIRSVNEDILLFISSPFLCTEELLKSIEFKIDGYLLENLCEDVLFNQINKSIQKLIKNQNNELHQKYFGIANDNIIISKTDTKGIITYVNDKFCEVSGFSKGELIGSNHNIVRHMDNDKSVFDDLWQTIKVEKNTWEGILKNNKKNNESYYVKSMMIPILDNEKNIVEYISFNTNISEIMCDKNQLLNDIHDNELSILVLVEIEEYDNLEKFYTERLINKVEQKFGNTLLSNLSEDELFKKIYFLGSGRYAFLCNFNSYSKLEKNEESDITKYLNNFVKKVNKSEIRLDKFEDELNIILSFSYGKYRLYEDAKQGLLEAKLKNKKVHPSNDAYHREQKFAKINMNIIKMVKTALDNYNIISYFQPIINNNTKEIEKHESLVRLIDEDGNVLSPYSFLKVAKDSSYYHDITYRVLRNSFKVLSKINTEVSINLSLSDIESKKVRDVIYELLEEYSEYSSKVVFELLEDENVNNFNTIKEFIKNVKVRGVKIAIDDFGSGYSNFERILCFEPDIIKIDGSLIKDIKSDVFARNIVETISTFAKKQNIKTIAEYVEDENTFTILNEIGIDYSQGYFFGKPEKLAFC